MLTYAQRSGELVDAEGYLIGIGYSGDGVGLNNPAAQKLARTGPIPVGLYTIGKPLEPIDHLGPIAMPLTPAKGNVMFGRSGFFMHGDNQAMNHTASLGCIVMLKIARISVRDGEDHELEVVTELPD